jgi:hypothetical protein
MSETAIISAVVNTFGPKVLERLSDDELDEFREKLEDIELVTGFATGSSPSFTRPLDAPPAPDWKDEDEMDIEVDETVEEISLEPSTKDLIYIKFTLVGSLISNRIDIAITLPDSMKVLTEDEIPESIDAATHYDTGAILPATIRRRMSQQPKANISSQEDAKPTYLNLSRSYEWSWSPFCPPIRTATEIKGKVEGNIFPGDSVLLPVWIATPDEEGEYDIQTRANPQNPAIDASTSELTVEIGT